MPTQRLTFPGASGHHLAARLELPPNGDALTYALFAHCFTCSKNIRAAVDLTRALSALGVGVLRFDFTGLGESDGDFAETSFSSNVDDLEAAARFMARELHAPSILIGHSLGGAAVLHAAARLEAVRAVVTIGAPADPKHVLEHMTSSLDAIEAEGEATVEIAGRPFRVKRQFLDDLEATRMRDVVSRLEAAILILHSPRDEIVGIDNAARLYQMARHPKSFVTLDDADHLLTEAGDSVYVAKLLAAWAERYVEVRPDPAEAGELRDAERVVTRTRSGTLYTEIGVRRHSLVADEPVAVGGDDAGPTPYDYLLVALGACTSMTLQMYARRKGWPLEEALVRLRHRRLHARDCDRCEQGDERLDAVRREIELVGPLSTEQVRRLVEIANRCPVHRTLDAGVRIETSHGA